ncbi:EamA family transporter [Thermococcus atlanticus]
MISGRVKITVSMLIWGSVGIFSRFTHLTGLGVAFFRVSLGALLFLGIYSFREPMWLKRVHGELRGNWMWILLLGAALALNWVFLFTAFLYTTIAEAVLVYYTAPIIAVIISARFLGEKITGTRVFLIALAFMGVITIMSGEGVSTANKGLILALLAAFFYALIPNLGRFLSGMDSEVLTFSQLAVAAAILAPFVSVAGVSSGGISWPAVGVLVVVHTVLALLLYMKGLREVEVNEAALLSYLDPLSAVVYAFLIFGEIPSLRTAVGGLLILSASLADILKKR